MKRPTLRAKLTLPACALLLATVGAMPASGVAGVPLPAEVVPLLLKVEGEAGTPVDRFCSSDGEQMLVLPDSMFFPESGCEARYPGPNLPLAVRFGTTAWGGPYCGHFEFSGGAVGRSATACSDGHYVIANVDAIPIAAAPIHARWVVDGGPSWVNAWLDYIAVASAPVGV